MSRKNYLLLYVVCLVVLIAAAWIEVTPGYMDAEYYTLNGEQIASGQGLTEPIIWNYLASPQSLPAPSHLYWMPLSSFVAAVGIIVSHQDNFLGARWLFIVLGAFLAPITASLSFRLNHKISTAWLAGGFAIFSGFYLPRLVTTDTFALVMILGTIILILVGDQKNGSYKMVWFRAAACGLLSGLMHLARADGLLWLAFSWFGLALTIKSMENANQKEFLFKAGGMIPALLSGYCLIMVPWMVRTYQVSGSILSPGGNLSMWFTNYDQLFSLHIDDITPLTWWASGLGSIFKARWDALIWNLQSTLAIQMGIVLFPLVIIGLWNLRKDIRVQTGTMAWLGLFALMTIVFPFSGSRGGWFHSGAALQPLFWASAAIGLTSLVEHGHRKRGWQIRQATMVFSSGLLVICALVTWVAYQRIVIGSDPGEVNWNASFSQAERIGEALKVAGADRQDVILVNNPPGFYLATGYQAVVIPDGDLNSLEEAANRYGATYAVFDENIVQGLRSIYDDPQDVNGMSLLVNEGDYQIYQFTGES